MNITKNKFITMNLLMFLIITTFSIYFHFNKDLKLKITFTYPGIELDIFFDALFKGKFYSKHKMYDFMEQIMQSEKIVSEILNDEKLHYLKDKFHSNKTTRLGDKSKPIIKIEFNGFSSEGDALKFFTEYIDKNSKYLSALFYKYFNYDMMNRNFKSEEVISYFIVTSIFMDNYHNEGIITNSFSYKIVNNNYSKILYILYLIIIVNIILLSYFLFNFLNQNAKYNNKK